MSQFAFVFFWVFYRCWRKVRVGCDYTRIVEIFTSTKSISKFQQFIFQDYDSTIWIPWFSMCFGDRFCPRSAVSHPSNDFRLSRSWMSAASEPGMERPPQHGPEERGDREKPRAKAAGNGHRPQAKCHENFKGRLLAPKARGLSEVIWLVCVVYMVWDMIIFDFLWFVMTFWVIL